MAEEQKVYPDGKPITAEDILLAVQNDEGIEYARVPGFKPGQVFVIQSISAGDIITWSEASEGDAKRTAGLRLIVLSVVDGQPGVDEGAKGRRIMDDSHITVLRKLPHKATEGVVKAIIKHNGMSVKTDKETKND